MKWTTQVVAILSLGGRELETQKETHPHPDPLPSRERFSCQLIRALQARLEPSIPLMIMILRRVEKNAYTQVGPLDRRRGGFVAPSSFRGSSSSYLNPTNSIAGSTSWRATTDTLFGRRSLSVSVSLALALSVSVSVSLSVS